MNIFTVDSSVVEAGFWQQFTTASDSHRLGFIDMHKMRQYDALCVGTVPAYDSEKIRALRGHLKLSQAVLASVLNTSL